MSTTLEQPELNETTESELPPFPVKRWSLKEYRQLADAGVLDDENLELIDGWICEKMPKNPLHESTLTRVLRLGLRIMGTDDVPRVQQVFSTETSEIEPDFAIVNGPDDTYDHRHPGGSDTKLIVEVSDSSLTADRRKALVYAAAGVPEYWIVNLQKNCIEVYQRLNPNTRQYLIQQTLTPQQTIQIQLGEQTYTISVADLLPTSSSK